MRYISLILCVFFIGFAAVQYNDPDPLVWIILYGYAAFICLLGFLRRYFFAVTLGAALVYLAGGIYLFPPSFSQWLHLEESQQSMGMHLPFIEEARESLGLLIAFGAMVFHLWVAYRHGRSQRKNPDTQPGKGNIILK